MVGAKEIAYTDPATLKHLGSRRKTSHNSSIGFYSYKNLIWKSEIRKEQKIVWLLILQEFKKPIDFSRDDTLLEITIFSPRY